MRRRFVRPDVLTGRSQSALFHVACLPLHYAFLFSFYLLSGDKRLSVPLGSECNCMDFYPVAEQLFICKVVHVWSFRVRVRVRVMLSLTHATELIQAH